MGRILILGSANMDLVVRSARLPSAGETVLGHGYFQAHGGKGANQAVAAARAGGDVTFLGAVGDDDFGRSAMERLRAEGINVDHVRLAADRPTGVALIMVGDDGRNMIAVHAGANESVTPEMIDALPESLFAAHGVFVAQLEVPPAAVGRALARAREAGAFTMLNPAPAGSAADLVELIRSADLIVPNESEARMLTGIAAEDSESATRAARALLSMGCRGAIITLGERGCVVARTAGEGRGGSDMVEHLPARNVAAVDTVGAGDAFVGALACALAETASREGDPFANPVPAVRRAILAASISVTRSGAQSSMPTRAEIDAAEREGG